MSTVSITSINGKRCTARRRAPTRLPQSVATTYSTTSTPVVSTITTTVDPPTTAQATTTSTTEDTTAAISTTVDSPTILQTSTPISTPEQTSTTTTTTILPPPVVAQTTTPEPAISSTFADASTSTTAVIQPTPTSILPTTTLISSRPTVSFVPSSPAVPSTTSLLVAATPTSRDVPLPATLSSTKARSTKPIPSSAIRTSRISPSSTGSAVVPTSSSTPDPGVVSIPPTDTALAQEDNVPLIEQKGAMVGGIVGGVAFVALLALIAWILFKRRKKQKQNQSLLRPLSSPSSETKSGFYDDDDDDEPTILGRIQNVVATVNRKARVVLGDIKQKARPGPRINLDRGNSQFMVPAPVAQHSRNTSTASTQSANQEPVLTPWQKLKWTIRFKLANHEVPSRPKNPFSKKEKGYGVDTKSDLAKFIDQQRRNSIAKVPLSVDTHRRSSSQQGNLPPLVNPFADPRQPTIPTLISPQQGLFSDLSPNPFADPLPTASSIQSPKVTSSRPRAPSSGMPSTMLPTIVELPTPQLSRLPSEISSTRSTMLEDDRAAKGRSDPFNLSPPDVSYLVQINIPTLPSLYNYPDQAPKPLAPLKTFKDTSGVAGLSLFGYGAAGLAGIAPGKEGVGRPSQEGGRPSMDNLRPSLDKLRPLPPKISPLPPIPASPRAKGLPSPIPARGPTSNLLDSLSETRRMSGQRSPMEARAPMSSIWMNPNLLGKTSSTQVKGNGGRLLGEDEPVVGSRQGRDINSTLSSSIYSQSGVGSYEEWAGR